MPMEKKVFKSMLIISAFFIVSCTSMPSEFELADIRKEQSGKTEVKLYEKLNFKDHYKQWKKILEKDEVYAQSQKGIRFVYALNYYYQTVADESTRQDIREIVAEMIKNGLRGDSNIDNIEIDLKHIPWDDNGKIVNSRNDRYVYNVFDLLFSYQMKNDYTNFDIVEMFLKTYSIYNGLSFGLSIEMGKTVFLDKLKSWGASIEKFKNPEKLLYIACESGQIDFVEKYISSGIEVHSTSNYRSDSIASYLDSLGVAIKNKHYEVINILLKSNKFSFSWYSEMKKQGIKYVNPYGIALLMQDSQTLELFGFDKQDLIVNIPSIYNAESTSKTPALISVYTPYGLADFYLATFISEQTSGVSNTLRYTEFNVNGKLSAYIYPGDYIISDYQCLWTNDQSRNTIFFIKPNLYPDNKYIPISFTKKLK